MDDAEVEEAALIDETLEGEHLLKDMEEEEVLGEGKFTESQFAKYINPFVQDGANGMIHKQTVIKRMNQGRSVSKTTDRPGCVQGVRKYCGRSGLSSNQTIVGKAFDAAVGTMNNVWDETGNDQLKAGDYCTVFIKSKQGDG